MQDTIYAPASGLQACAVSIVRVSGPRARAIGRRFCGKDLTPREASYCRVHDPVDHELIDAGLVIFFEGPASFTGEDSLEFQLHGSRAVVARMLRALAREPEARMAEPGEFIRRAFDNGKLALTSVEGVADLIEAQTDLQRRQALMQASGGLADKARRWREMLLEALALCTAEIDFADEGEAPSGVAQEVLTIVEHLRSEYRSALDDADRAEICRHGYRVVLCGPPNAGKSSLMNAIARRDVAIVTEHAGTTRDVIEVQLDLNGVPVVLLDTAGLREARDEVEAIGIERSRRAMEAADLVLWLNPASSAEPFFEAHDGPGLSVASKLDEVGGAPVWASLGVSSLTSVGIGELEKRIAELAKERLSGETPVVTNARQRSYIAAGLRHLDQLAASEFGQIEIVADDLYRCADLLQGLVGRIGADDVLGAVFSRFCMGK